MTGREILLAAMREYEKTYIDEIPLSEEDVPLDEEALPGLLFHVKHAKHPFFRLFDTVSKRAVSVAAVLVLLVGCFVMVPPIDGRYQKPSFHRLRVVFFGEEEAPKTLETRYTLGYVPKGYHEKTAESETSDPTKKDKSTQRVWTDGGALEIVLTQSTLDKRDWGLDMVVISDIGIPDYQLPIFSKDTLVDVITVGQYPLRDSMLYYWSAKDYFYSLRVPMGMPWEECEAMIRSLAELEP